LALQNLVAMGVELDHEAVAAGGYSLALTPAIH
jgi:hypothetical protein